MREIKQKVKIFLKTTILINLKLHKNSELLTAKLPLPYRAKAFRM